MRGVFALTCGAKNGETLGRSQVVRHRSLEPAFVGSNPSAPANIAVQSPMSKVQSQRQILDIGLWTLDFGHYDHDRRHQSFFGQRESGVDRRDLQLSELRSGACDDRSLLGR